MTETVTPQLQAVFERERADARRVVARDGDAVRAQVVRMYARLASEQEAVIDASKLGLACERGCNYCCHQRVEIRPYEAFVLVEHIRAHFSEAKQAGVKARLAANRARIAPLAPLEHTQAGIACALLEEGVCSVYEARPAACRKYYSLSVDTCRTAFEHPKEPLMGPLEDDALRLAGNAVALGFARGVEESGRDTNRYELQGALLDALDSPKAAKRYRDGKKAFV
ncbi:MAG: YkgJ family cysteine cluster protein [Usitatibacteraceae bacterium]